MNYLHTNGDLDKIAELRNLPINVLKHLACNQWVDDEFVQSISHAINVKIHFHYFLITPLLKAL